MTLPYPIDPSQTDANSPVDDTLMDAIRLDLDYLDAILSSQGAIFSFNVNGPLQRLLGYMKPVDTVSLYNEFTPNKIRAILKKSGTAGTLRIDLRKMKSPKIPIVGVAHLFEGATQSIGNINPAIATQSVGRATPQIAIQSISYAKAAPNILSIINVGGNLWRYNLDSAPDADWDGAQVTFDSATASGNNGTFPIHEINQSGYPSVVVDNASGVAQTTPDGTAQVNIMSYNFSNPVNADFTVGDSAVFASATDGSNNGTFPIFKRNQSGNNIWIVNVGAEQASAAGTADTLVWVYTFTAGAPTPDFTVGEKAKMTSHSSGGNDGNLLIRRINSGGNNLVVYNTAGVAQAGVAGAVGTNRWSYSLGVDPTSDITAGDSLQLEGHTNPANNLITNAVQVNRLAVNNIIIYNEAGVAQGSVVGFVRTSKKLIKFASDQSTLFADNVSLIDLIELIDPTYNLNDNVDAWPVLGQNYGGGANFNVIILAPGGASQVNPAGYVYTEYRSILTAPFEVGSDVTALSENRYVGAMTTDLDGLVIPDQTPIGLFLLSTPDGDPSDLTVIMH